MSQIYYDRPEISTGASIIKQNSDAIASIPRDLGLLNHKLDSMEKKLDMIFMDKFEIKPKQK